LLKTLALLEAGMGNLRDAQRYFNRIIDSTMARLPELGPVGVDDLIETFRAKADVDGQLKDGEALRSTLESALKVVSSTFGPADRRLDDFALMLFRLGLYEIGRNQKEEGKRIAAEARAYLAAAGAPPHILAGLDNLLWRAEQRR
jgi:hypothetical protein